MTGRQEKLLYALAKRPCATLGPCDLIDEDYLSLVRNGYIREYWGGGGVHCVATDIGRAAVGLPIVDLSVIETQG